jgi:DNA repair protein RecN (Recombination protein N)
MLISLSIKNYALIEEVSLLLDRGLTVITGETGAGKSILIGALGLLLGDRANTDSVRTGADKAVVEGIFDVRAVEKIDAWFRTNEAESATEVIVRREVSSKGSSRCFVNDSPVTLSQLKELGDILVDMHGQHEHQSLLRAETHCGFLDDFGTYQKELTDYKEAYATLVSLTSRKRSLHEREKQLKERKALFAYQLKDIDGVAPREDEEEQLEAELKVLEHSETLSVTTSQINETLYEGDASVHDNLVRVRQQLGELCEIDAAFSDSLSEAKSAVVIVEELAHFVQRYRSHIEFNTERLDEIRDRLGAFTLLKKKYGALLLLILSFC